MYVSSCKMVIMAGGRKLGQIIFMFLIFWFDRVTHADNYTIRGRIWVLLIKLQKYFFWGGGGKGERFY